MFLLNLIQLDYLRNRTVQKKVRGSPVKVEEKRSPIKKLRIKIPRPPVQESKSNVKIPKEKVELSKLAYNTYMAEDPDAILSTRKSEISFALNILPKKNETVDVEKAFGNDSSFLPRPLSPDLNDPILNEEEMIGKELAEPSIAISGQMESNSVSIANIGPEVISTNIDSSISSSVVPASNSILESSAIMKPVVNPILNISSKSKKGVSVFAVSPTTTGAAENKTLPSTPVASLGVCSEKPVSLDSQTSSSSTKKPVITVPSSTATLLVSGQTYKISSGKFLQLLSKGPVSIKPKNAVIPTIVKPGESTSTGLGTNIVVSEHQANIPKKIETSSSATYVKLASPSLPQNCRPLKDFKISQTSSFPARMETPAEMAEKRLAIQALNNSLQCESVTSATKAGEESGYSICYTKPDGSIITRRVIRPPIRTTVKPHTSLL